MLTIGAVSRHRSSYQTIPIRFCFEAHLSTFIGQLELNLNIVFELSLNFSVQMAEQNKDPIPNPEANKSVAPTDKRYLLDMPDWIREFLAEFLGTFLQLVFFFSSLSFLTLASFGQHLLNSALMLYYIEPTSAVRLYSDPTICSEPSHESTNRSVSSCSSLATPVKGRMRGDIQYDVSLDAIFIIIIAFAWGAGHMVGLLVSMPVSGGFLNPAISLALASLNLMPRRKVLNLIPAQYLGSFFSAFMIHS